MRNHKIPVGIFVLLLCLAINAQAQETGWYAGGGAGISLTAVDEDFWVDSSVSSTEHKRWGPAFQIFGGYRMHQNLALELGYTRFSETVFKGVSDGEGSIWVAGPIEGRTAIEGISIQGVGFWPLSNLDLVLYLKGGFFLWDSLAKYNTPTINVLQRFNDDGGTLIGGMGAEMKAWNDWRFRGEFQVTTVRFANREVVPALNMTVGLVHPLN